jgi:tetraacyldisaccharide 4'-kinase
VAGVIGRQWLLPLVPLYRLALRYREMRLGSDQEPVRRLRFPVISVGNLSIGGSGKTPFTIALARLLISKGIRVDVLSRGYGRRDHRPARVNFDGTAEAYGDEPLLIARETGAPVYVAPQRYDAGLMAEQPFEPSQVSGQNLRRADAAIQEKAALTPERTLIHILDDGFQHRQLFRDVDILLVHSADFHDHLLPAGNLREPLHAARRASVLAIPAEDSDFESELRAWGWTGPIWHIHRRMDIPGVAGPVLAFCGIARPDQFFAGLESAGVRIAARTAFRDHHPYNREDVNRLLAAAQARGATALITTKKDRVRLGTLASQLSTELPLETADLRIEFEDPEAVVEWLDERLSLFDTTHSRPHIK